MTCLLELPNPPERNMTLCNLKNSERKTINGYKFTYMCGEEKVVSKVKKTKAVFFV